MDNLVLRDNAFNRSANHQVMIPSALQTWIQGIQVTELENQSDVTPPVISSSDTISWVVTGTFGFDITITENSYAITLPDNFNPAA